MYPTLFTIGSLRIDTYSVMWFIALSLAILWSIKRLELYELDDYEARRIMAVSFLFMLLGARSPEYFINWKAYMNNPKLLLDLNRGGLHEFGAVAGAFLSAFVMSMFNRKISFWKLCDVAVIPAFLAIAVGRWGCFLNGCCLGLPTDFITGVHFPRDRAGVFRHPVQIYYSLFAAMTVMILLWVERRVLPLQKRARRYYSVLAPLGIIMYALMRYSISVTRSPGAFSKRFFTAWLYKGINIALLIAVMWLGVSAVMFMRERAKREVYTKS